MANTQARTHADPALQTLTGEEIAEVHGGRTVYLDGMKVEMSESSIAALLKSGAAKAVVIKGVDNTWHVGGPPTTIRI